MTNFDVIKQMTVEELGKFLNHVDCANCGHSNDDNATLSVEELTKWLESKADWWMSDYIKENNV